MGLTLKEAKKFLKVYKKAYRLILKMYQCWYTVPLKHALEEKTYIEENIASYTELVKKIKKESKGKLLGKEVAK